MPEEFNGINRMFQIAMMLAANGTIGNECKVCEYAKWGEDNKPPTCSENMTLVIFTLIEGVLKSER